MRKGVKPGKLIVVIFTSALLYATLAATCAWSYPRFGPDNIHNMVGDGFTGGGTCDECHAMESTAIVGDRLLRWGTGGDTDGQLCAANCHNDPGNALPVRTEWNGVIAPRANPPPANPHAVIPVDCDECHNVNFALDTTRHAALASTMYCDCLRCHTTDMSDALMGEVPAGSDFGRDTEVDKFFIAVGDTSAGVTIAGHLSDHTIVYDDSADLCNETNNECLKCHAGAGAFATNTHPGVDFNNSPAILFYPDDIGAVTAGTPIIAPDLNVAFGDPPSPGGGDWDVYLQASRQAFCLSCHDGVNTAPPANMTIGGINLPVVPQQTFTLTPGNPPTPGVAATAPPYFPFYESNGHGIPFGIEGVDDLGNPTGNFKMNLTCMAGVDPGAANPTPGCHSAHGTANMSNLEDTNFAAGVDTLGEMGSNVCMSTNCHSTARMATYPYNLFHGMWSGPGRFLHIDEERERQSTATWDPLARQISMNLDSVTQTNGNLWFFESPDAVLPAAAARPLIGDYSGVPDDVKDNEIGCITCHDPHGTSGDYWNYIDNAWGTQGMIKRFITTVDYSDDLCGQCHVKP